MKAGEDENEETEELEEDEPIEVPEETASETDDDGQDDTTQEEVPTTTNSTRRKPFVPKRIDNRWDPNHPLYDQIQKGFPSNLKRLETRNVHAALKDLRVEKFDTKQVSNTNVYLKEARRIYPKAFPESEPSDHKTRKANTQPSEPLNSDTMKRYHPEKLDREVTLYGKKYIQRTVNHKQSTGHTPRNVKHTQRPTTGKGTVNKQDTSMLKKATTPRFRPNLRANKVNTEEGKLNKERDKVKYYQDYLDNTEAIPAPKSRQSKNKVAPQTSRNPTKGGKTAVHTAKFNSQQQQHANCVDDGDGDDDDNKDVTHDDTDTGPSVTRETANEKLEPLSSPRSLGSDRRTEDVPISKAVEIVQSRHKFYDNERCEIQTNQRDHRVFKLFREIQMIRRKGDNSDEPEAGMNTSGFLMMDYEFSRSTFSSQKTDGELQRFLRNSLDYEVCVRSRSLQSYPRRRDKALCELRQKLDQPLVYSSNLR